MVQQPGPGFSSWTARFVCCPVQAGSPICQVLFSALHGTGTEMSPNTVSVAANGAFKWVVLPPSVPSYPLTAWQRPRPESDSVAIAPVLVVRSKQRLGLPQQCITDLLTTHLQASHEEVPPLRRCFRAADGALKAMPMAIAKHSSQNFTCHAWVIEGAPKQHN